MDHHEPSKRVRRLLREFAARAHEEELRRALATLAKGFERWARREIDGFELSDLVHEFHQGPSRDLFLRYSTRPHDSAVAYAIVAGIIDRREVPEELLQHLALALEYYAREELRESCAADPEWAQKTEMVVQAGNDGIVIMPKGRST